MSEAHNIAMLGTGFIADFYTGTLHSQRTRDRVHTVYSRLSLIHISEPTARDG